MRTRFSNHPDWHCASNLRWLKSVYLDQIEKLAHERQSQLSICKCRFCLIEFLTAKSNLTRSDLLCMFGCRERHKKNSANVRSRKRNQIVEGKRKKRILNRHRSKSGGGSTLLPRSDTALDSRRLYYRWLIWKIDGAHLSFQELAEFILSILERVRSRGLENFGSICDIPDS